MAFTCVFQCGCFETNHQMDPSITQVIFNQGPCADPELHCVYTDQKWFDEQDYTNRPSDADYDSLNRLQGVVDDCHINACDVVFDLREITPPWFVVTNLRAVLPPGVANMLNDIEPLDKQLESYVDFPVEVARQWLERACALTESCAPYMHRRFAFNTVRNALNEASDRHNQVELAVRELTYLANNPTQCFRLNGEPFRYEPNFGVQALKLLRSHEAETGNLLEQPFSVETARRAEEIVDHLKKVSAMSAPPAPPAPPAPSEKTKQAPSSRKRKYVHPDPVYAHLDRVWDEFCRDQIRDRAQKRRKTTFASRATPIDFSKLKRS